MLNENITKINNQNDKINKMEEKINLLENLLKTNDVSNENNIITNLNSNIIKDNIIYKKTIKNWINPNKNIKADLLYRLSKDGNYTSTFHQKCDNKGPTLSIFNLKDGNNVGLYTSLDWDTSSLWKSDLNSFIFNLNKNTIYKKKSNLSIYC